MNFPNNSADPGPERRPVPDRPDVPSSNGPFVNRALLDSLYPPGALLKNTGVVIFDSPDSRQPVRAPGHDRLRA